MSTDYRPLNQIPFNDIFDGRLEKYGVYQFNPKITSKSPRFLIAGDEALEVYPRPGGNSSLQRPTFKPVPTTILNAISTEFQTELVGDHDHRYWGFDTEEEWSHLMATMAGQDEDEFYHDALRFCRGELNNLEPGTIGYAKAEIARELIDRNSNLANPERRGALLLAIAETYAQRSPPITIHLSDEDLANTELLIAPTTIDTTHPRDQQHGEQAAPTDLHLTVGQWHQIRKDAATKIDPTTAEVTWRWSYTMDPYDLNPNLADELKQIGRVYFAKSPDSNIWVCFDDLPDDVLRALYACGATSK